MAERDFYEILGVGRGAPQQEIKRAYRRLAQQFHPDKNPDDPSAEDRFKELGEAYSVLSDPERRAHFDRFGRAPGNAAGGGGFDFSGGGIDDLFSDIFGDFFGTRGRRRRAGRPGADLRYNLSVSFDDAVFGTEAEITVPRREPCPDCGGSRAKPGTEARSCPSCNGRGQVHMQQGFFTVSRPCAACRGTGSVIDEPCPTCSGAGSVRRPRTLNVKIPPGVEDGMRLRLPGNGDLGEGQGPPGDLYVVLTVTPHPIFERHGNDVICELPLSFVDVALGGEVEVPTLESKETIDIPPGTQHGAEFVLKGKGAPDLSGYGRGHQRVRVHVEVPTQLTARQQELLREFAEESGEDHNPLRKSFFQKVKELFE